MVNQQQLNNELIKLQILDLDFCSSKDLNSITNEQYETFFYAIQKIHKKGLIEDKQNFFANRLKRFNSKDQSGLLSLFQFYLQDQVALKEESEEEGDYSSEKVESVLVEENELPEPTEEDYDAVLELLAEFAREDDSEAQVEDVAYESSKEGVEVKKLADTASIPSEQVFEPPVEEPAETSQASQEQLRMLYGGAAFNFNPDYVGYGDQSSFTESEEDITQSSTADIQETTEIKATTEPSKTPEEAPVKQAEYAQPANEIKPYKRTMCCDISSKNRSQRRDEFYERNSYRRIEDTHQRNQPEYKEADIQSRRRTQQLDSRQDIAEPRTKLFSNRYLKRMFQYHKFEHKKLDGHSSYCYYLIDSKENINKLKQQKHQTRKEEINSRKRQLALC